MKWRGKVSVYLKEKVYDPQGAALSRTLQERGYPVGDIRVGKKMELEIESPSRKEAEQRLAEICAEVLANPVIEDFDYFVEEMEQ